MREALEGCLALRQASEAGSSVRPGRREPDCREPQTEEPQPIQVLADGCPSDTAGETRVPEVNRPELKSEVTESILAAYFGDLLAAHPSARLVKDRLALADDLALGVIERFGDPRLVSWQSDRPLCHYKWDKAIWVAQCPAGHMTDEVIDSHELLGWVCEACRRVYDTTECRLVSL